MNNDLTGLFLLFFCSSFLTGCAPSCKLLVCTAWQACNVKLVHTSAFYATTVIVVHKALQQSVSIGSKQDSNHRVKTCFGFRV